MTQSVERPTFQQAGIRVERPDEFEQLHSALMRIFAPAGVEKFLRLLQRKGVPIRDFDRVLRERLLESSDSTLAKSGKTELSSNLSRRTRSKSRNGTPL